MCTDDFHRSLASLFSELVHGVPKDAAAFMLNPGDVGLLTSLDQLSADVASKSANGGATIAAHVNHLRYGLSLMNRWAGGEANPFGMQTVRSRGEQPWLTRTNGLSCARRYAKKWSSGRARSARRAKSAGSNWMG